MATDRKSSMKAFAAALRAFADVVESEDAPAGDGKPVNKKGAAAAATAAAGASPADVANRAPAAAATGDLMAQCRQAAKSYAEVYGREGLKEVLSKYTQGTLADVSADRLPDLLKDLS